MKCTATVHNHYTEYHNEQGELHNEYGPAYYHEGGQSVRYHLCGKLHREWGPAIPSVLTHGCSKFGGYWYINGKCIDDDEERYCNHLVFIIVRAMMQMTEFYRRTSVSNDAERFDEVRSRLHDICHCLAKCKEYGLLADADGEWGFPLGPRAKQALAAIDLRDYNMPSEHLEDHNRFRTRLWQKANLKPKPNFNFDVFTPPLMVGDAQHSSRAQAKMQQEMFAAKIKEVSNDFAKWHKAIDYVEGAR